MYCVTLKIRRYCRRDTANYMSGSSIFMSKQTPNNTVLLLCMPIVFNKQRNNVHRFYQFAWSFLVNHLLCCNYSYCSVFRVHRLRNTAWNKWVNVVTHWTDLLPLFVHGNKAFHFIYGLSMILRQCMESPLERDPGIQVGKKTLSYLLISSGAKQAPAE